jgi:spermidine synthase
MQAASPRAQESSVFVDSAEIPHGGELHLIRHGSDFEILYEEEQLMSSWESGSEVALATFTCRRLGPGGGRVLIGGLGMGFTLNAARTALPATATIVVAELVPKIVEWARGPLAHLFEGSLEDPRVTVAMGDVHDVIVGSPDGFDAIMLDVDNGPEGLIDIANERLYCNWGLRAARTALKPGGVLAVWSAFRDDAFAARFAKAGFQVDEEYVEDEGNPARSGYTIWLGTRLES